MKNIIYIALLTSDVSVSRLIVGEEEEEVKERAAAMIAAHNEAYKIESFVKYDLVEHLTCYIAI